MRERGRGRGRAREECSKTVGRNPDGAGSGRRDHRLGQSYLGLMDSMARAISVPDGHRPVVGPSADNEDEDDDDDDYYYYGAGATHWGHMPDRR